MGLLRFLTERFKSAAPSGRPTQSTAPPVAQDSFQYQACVLEGRGVFSTEIVGESHYVPEIDLAIGNRKPWEEECTFEAVLAPDRQNSFDRNAVAICRQGGGVLGHLPREVAAKWRPALDELYNRFRLVAICKAIVHARADGPKGVWLDVELKHIKNELAARLADHSAAPPHQL